jgi:plastocyanin
MRVLRLTAVAMLVAACGGGGGSSYGSGPNQTPGNNNPQTYATVTAPNLAFSPEAVSLARNGSVTWTFGATEHGVVFDTPGSPSGIAACQNCSNAKAFPTAGTFEYHCPVHGQMTGTITVK